MSGDRFGLSWRPELALAIHRHLERIDVLEFLAEDWLEAPPARLATLRAWSAQRPVHLHGTGLGLASAVPVCPRRLAAWARLVAAVRPARWSEHLAFVRGGGIELGHLAAPPRSPGTVAGAMRNLTLAAAAVGAPPLVENVATLVDPPGSSLAEEAWLAAIAAGSGAGILLDLHNLHANAVNAGRDPAAVLDRMPLGGVAAVHLAGGRWWRGRILDDHLHAVPEAVWALLRRLAARVPGPLDVIIERDGAFPPEAELLGELERARAEVAAGRAEARPADASDHRIPIGAGSPEDAELEAVLARLLTDAGMRRALVDGSLTGVPEMVMARLTMVDRDGLELAADSLAAKRARRVAAAGRDPVA